MSNKIIMLNISWMKEYDGNKPGYDVPINGGKYPRMNSKAHEEYNFTNVENYFFGHVETIRGDIDSSINIQRLGAKESDDYINGVLIIWIATPAGGGRQVIGWWKNATVFRKRQIAPKNSPESKLRSGNSYITKAKIKDCVLLRPLEREKYPFNFPVHEKRYWPGQSSRYYPVIQAKISSTFKTYFDHLLKEIKIFTPERKTKKTKRGKGFSRKGTSALHRSKVENSAVDFITKYYQKKYLPQDIVDVSKENKGWDLEVFLDESDSSLNVEAKGLSGNNPSIGLTPNEYRIFQEKRTEYRLFIVTNCLSGKKNGFEVYWTGKTWVINKINSEFKVIRNKLEVDIKEIMAAQIKLD